MNNNGKLWAEVRKRYRLSLRHLQMAQKLGLNPKKIGRLAPDKSQPWKISLSKYIEKMYVKRYSKSELMAVSQPREQKNKKKNSVDCIDSRHRLWKQKVHSIFNFVCNERHRRSGVSKSKAKRLGSFWLANELNVCPKEFSIGQLDIEQCKAAVKRLDEVAARIKKSNEGA